MDQGPEGLGCYEKDSQAEGRRILGPWWPSHGCGRYGGRRRRRLRCIRCETKGTGRRARALFLAGSSRSTASECSPARSGSETSSLLLPGSPYTPRCCSPYSQAERGLAKYYGVLRSRLAWCLGTRRRLLSFLAVSLLGAAKLSGCVFSSCC